ncbi:type VI secretion system-associated protein [Desulfovibrio sp. An276]|uniref:type VI secretion system contractile sheath small subunit n=1 Tax=Desulfovibrio sp. An276 TaxID=1965618 RepID=UPI000B367B9B|nr:type VI secretion system contractile sheath small subunit [Desulfovibrio sp. An276]OUO51092.1 type VI secretion system-associated protein [Desulfovibrio sp. An276]
MSKETSIAPKERINIVYRPAIGDVQEDVELPLKTLVIGDFTLRADSVPVEERKPINVAKDNFDEVMQGQGITLEMMVPNRLQDSPDSGELAVSLKFENMNDFSPDVIVDSVPELRQLMELRAALKALKSPLSNIPEFRKKLQRIVQDEALRARLLADLGLDEE